MKAGTDSVRKSRKASGSENLNANQMQSGNACSPDDVIAVAAYFRAERRGFEPGHELDDWIQAESEHKTAA